MKNFLDGLRGSVRPLVTFALIGVILGMVFKFAAPYIDKDAAQLVVGFVIGSGTTVMAYWFGERKAAK